MNRLTGEDPLVLINIIGGECLVSCISSMAIFNRPKPYTSQVCCHHGSNVLPPEPSSTAQQLQAARAPRMFPASSATDGTNETAAAVVRIGTGYWLIAWTTANQATGNYSLQIASFVFLITSARLLSIQVDFLGSE